MDYKKNLKYFMNVKSFKRYAIILGIIGALIIIWGISEEEFGIVALGLVIAAMGAGLYYLNNYFLSSDAAYDASVNAMKNSLDIDSMAYKALGIDPDEVREAAPISFEGFVYLGASLARLGKDNIWRTNRYMLSRIYFSANEVHCYKYIFSTTADYKAEATDVYFYKDVVSVSTDSNTIHIGDNDVGYDYFKLVTTGGTSFSSSFDHSEGVTRSVNGMRSLIKQKKLEG